jgi:hypothetical protein
MTYEEIPHLYVAVENNTTGTVALVAGVAGKRIRLLRVDIKTKTADDISLQQGSTQFSKFYCGATSAVSSSYGDFAYKLPDGVGLNLVKGVSGTAVTVEVWYHLV